METMSAEKEGGVKGSFEILFIYLKLSPSKSDMEEIKIVPPCSFSHTQISQTHPTFEDPGRTYEGGAENVGGFLLCLSLLCDLGTSFPCAPPVLHMNDIHLKL